MKKLVLLAAIAAALVGACFQLRAVDAPGSEIQREVQAWMANLQTDLKAGKNKEADLKDNLQALDKLIAKYKAEDAEGAAGLALLKAKVYVQILEDNSKATEVLQRIKADFPDTKAAATVDATIAQIKAMEESKKIQRSLAVGAKFPDFAVKDLNGAPLSVARYHGKVVLVDFWATWCGPCVHELPNVIEVYNNSHRKGFEVIGISLDTDKSKLESFINARKMPWSQYFDGKGWSNELAVKYGIHSIPATFLLDGEGKIIARDLRGDDLAAAVAKALGK